MVWIGLTGSIGSGKSTVSELLRKKGIPVVDADQLAREVVQPGTAGEFQVIQAFGDSVKDSNRHIDRKKLAAIVFSNQEKLKQLESIVHPLVQVETKRIRSQLERAGYPLAFYDVPLLFEKRLEAQFDGLVVVFAESETCIQRVMSRSLLTRAEVEARLRNQMPIEDKIQRAHWTVSNNGSLKDLDTAVENLLQDIGRKLPPSR